MKKFGEIVKTAYLLLFSFVVIAIGGIYIWLDNVTMGNIHIAYLVVIFIPALICISSLIISIPLFYVKLKRGWWVALVPFYNLIVLISEIMGSGWYVFVPLVSMIPILGWIMVLIFDIAFGLRTAWSFNKGVLFAILMALPVINILMIQVVVYGNSDFRKLTKFEWFHPFKREYLDKN